MNIGLVIYGSLNAVSGGYLYDRKLVEYLHAQGDTVELIALPWRNYPAHLMDNFSFRLPRGFDVILEDELNHPSLIFANRAPHPCPVISIVHHLRSSEFRPKWQNDFYRVVERKYLRSVDGFVFNSKTTEGVVNKLIGSGKPGIVAYPPTDRFGDALSEKNIIERARSSQFRILFLGNVIPRKGLHTLMEACEHLPSDFRLDVVGSLDSDPKYADRMQRIAKSSGLASNVVFHGALDNQPLVERYRQAHVLAVPSSYEGFGIVYLEGMGFGLPAIGTTAGAASEIINDGVDGFLIEPETPRALAEKLMVLAVKRDVLIEMSLAARDRYLRQPKWRQTAGLIRKFLWGMTR